MTTLDERLTEVEASGMGKEIARMQDELAEALMQRDAALARVKALEDAVRALQMVEDAGYVRSGLTFEKALLALYALLDKEATP